jgi:hypothetical protein
MEEIDALEEEVGRGAKYGGTGSNDSSQNRVIVDQYADIGRVGLQNHIERSLSSAGSQTYHMCDPAVFASFSTLMTSLFPSPAVHETMSESQKQSLLHFHDVFNKILSNPIKLEPVQFGNGSTTATPLKGAPDTSRTSQATMLGELMLTMTDLFPGMAAAIQGMSKRLSHTHRGGPAQTIGSPSKGSSTQLLQTSLSDVLAARIGGSKPRGHVVHVDASTPSKRTSLGDSEKSAAMGLRTPASVQPKQASDESALAFLAMAASMEDN